MWTGWRGSRVEWSKASSKQLQVEKWLERPPSIARGLFLPTGFYCLRLFFPAGLFSNCPLSHFITAFSIKLILNCAPTKILIRLSKFDNFSRKCIILNIWNVGDDDIRMQCSETGLHRWSRRRIQHWLVMVGGWKCNVGWKPGKVFAHSRCLHHPHHASVQQLHGHQSLDREQVQLLKASQLQYPDTNKSNLLDMHRCLLL